MKYGLATFTSDQTIGPAELAQLAEERGFESLWLPEHTHIPASRETPWPMGNGELPDYYARILDPFVALTAAAAVTTELKLGTGVVLVPQHDPIVLAKSVATLDFISGGRLLFGVGAGWNREEMRNHGTDPRRRMRVLQQRVEAMKAIWTQDEASYDGEYASFERIWSWPKPVQQPHPPIYIGGNGPTVLDRVLAFGDGWYPNPDVDDDRMLERIAELRQRCEDAGREPIPVTLNYASTRPERLARYIEAGIERIVFGLMPGGRDMIEARLEKIDAARAAMAV